LRDLGDSPVHHEHFAVVADHDVLGLEIAVDDSADVRVVHSHRDLLQHLDESHEAEMSQGLESADGAVAKNLVERPAAHELHREIHAVVTVEPKIVHRRNVGMLELTGRACFFEESAGGRRVTAWIAQDFERHDAAHVL